MAYYRDLRELLETLEAQDKLIKVNRVIDKDTELMPLVRWQFRGLPETQRKGFLFTKVKDAQGRLYNGGVAVATCAGSRDIYAIGMQCQPTEIMDRWASAQRNPLPPRLVDWGPVQEEVHIGEGILEHGGLGEFPFPISTPGFDNAPYLSAAHWITKDPETGGRNLGNYRAQVKGATRLGAAAHGENHMGMHWQKCRQRGIPLEAAVVLGGPPNVAFTAVGRVPYGVDELAVAGGIAGEPVDLVKCKTVDLEVPAYAEIVIEGLISTEYLEPEGPFGEFTGYMGTRSFDRPFLEVTCITHRRNPICQNLLSQMPPSESSKIRQMAYEGNYYKFLKYDCNIPTVLDVGFLEASGSWQFCVIQMRPSNPMQPWQALNAAVAYSPSIGKIFVTVDEDIDPRNAESLVWALSFRMQPHLDMRTTMGKSPGLDYSGFPPDIPSKTRSLYPEPRGSSGVLIDATRKWGYPPIALPQQKYMERAKAIWEELELPPLTPVTPWYGYSLGYWTDEDQEEAEIAVQGEYYQTGHKFAEQRIRADQAQIKGSGEHGR